LNAGECLILSVIPTPEYPRLISTSRHVTQGIFDVTSEKWDPSSKTLQCSSRLVGNDPCEMRVVLPSDDSRWTPAPVQLLERALADGVTVGKIQREGNLLRFTVTSKTDCEVSWKLAF